MKEDWKRPLRFGAVLFGLYLAVRYWSPLSSTAVLALRAASPLLLGCVIAYAVNILMSLYESWFLPNSSNPLIQSLRRPVCLILAFLSLAGIVVLIIRMILPELVQCVKLLILEAVPLLEQLTALLNENVDFSKLLASYGVALTDGSIDWRQALTSALSWLFQGLGGVMGSMVTLASSLLSTLFTLLISLIFSIYLLAGKEQLAEQTARLLRTYLKPVWYQRTLYFLQTLHSCFRHFLVGQCTEAVILGLLCIAGMMLLQLPYASMIGALIGFTALIPVAGAYIGAGVGAFMIFTVSPVKALIFLLFLSVLQQLEGNLIYPRVVGSSIGLPGIWVLAAVTVGGGLLGVFGMLLAVPLAATAYQILQSDLRRRQHVDAS